MTHQQATDLMLDWGKNLLPVDFCETLYLSIRGVGTKTFKSCSFHQEDDYLFIWTKTENYLLNRNEIGDFVAVSNPVETILTTKVT